ncbi:MAG: TPM domain-containing protein [Sphingobacterium sp.]
MLKTQKRIAKTLKKLTLLLSGLFFCIGVFAQDFPALPDQLVSDYTNSLKSEQVQHLERKLLAFEDSTSIQIAVVVMNSTGDYDIADYGDRLAQQWGIGNQKYDNGILMLVAVGDRAVTIRTGYGIEGAVPDVIAYRIIENEIKPAFRGGDYFQGIDKGTNALISYTQGEYKADPKESEEGKGGIPIIFIVIGAVILIAIISKGGDSGGKGGGRVMGGRGSSDLFWWTLLNALAGGGRGGGGGGFGGGGSGGFGGGGGGFGGFGGGGFGGGGASGRW